MRYKVLFSGTFSKELEIEAPSFEEAAEFAKQQKLEFPVKLKPKAMGESSSVDMLGYYEFDIIGPCGRCKKIMVDRPEAPVELDPENMEGPSICNACYKSIRPPTKS